MGIDGFHNFLKKKAPGVYKQVHLSSYQGKAIAVDISGLIYKFKVLNKERWLDNFAYLIFALRRNQIHPIFVYDGEAPPEKDQEKSKRAQSRKKIIDKVSSFREELDHYYQTGEIKSILQEENNWTIAKTCTKYLYIIFMNFNIDIVMSKKKTEKY